MSINSDSQSGATLFAQKWGMAGAAIGSTLAIYADRYADHHINH